MARTSLNQTSCLDLLKAMNDLGKFNGGEVVATFQVAGAGFFSCKMIQNERLDPHFFLAGSSFSCHFQRIFILQ